MLPHFFHDGISTTGHGFGSISSSGVQMIGGTNPAARHASLILPRSAALARCRRFRVNLAKLRQPGCKRSEENIVQALTGTWREEHLFVLAQSLQIYDHYTAMIAACETVARTAR